MEFFTTAAGITVHVWDTRDEKDPRPEPGVTSSVLPGSTPSVLPGSTGHLKPCLVLLHGYLETMYVFNELIEALKPSFRIITLDMPGHGLTDSAPADEDGRRINTLAFSADVVAGVLAKCGVDHAWVAGHSMGGYVAQQFLSAHPEKTDGIILLGSHPYPDAPEKAHDREKEKEFIRAGKLLSLAQIAVPNMYYEENLRACDEKIRETVSLCETHDPEGICSAIDGLRLRPDLRPVLENPPKPVLLVCGGHDNYIPAARIAEMKAAFPQVRFFQVEEAGHNAFIERQEAVVAAIERFTTENC